MFLSRNMNVLLQEFIHYITVITITLIAIIIPTIIRIAVTEPVSTNKEAATPLNSRKTRMKAR